MSFVVTQLPTFGMVEGAGESAGNDREGKVELLMKYTL